MTVAVGAAAQVVHAASRPPWKRGSAEADWRALSKADQYHHKATAGEVVLPGLLALPERPTVGEAPAFTDEEYAEAAAAGARALLEQRRPGAWDGLGDRKRRALVESGVALLRAAVAAMPVRQDPDGLLNLGASDGDGTGAGAAAGDGDEPSFEVPDHLPDDFFRD